MNSFDKEKYLLDFGRRIRALRISRGWTQEELAERCGYTSATKKSTINKIESGKSDLPTSKIKTFAEVFGISPAELVIGAKDKECCDLIENCYGRGVLNIVKKVLLLSIYDQGKVEGYIDQLLRDQELLSPESKNA